MPPTAIAGFPRYVEPRPSADTDVLALVIAWHNDTHPGHFMFCPERPCREISKEVR